MNEYDVVIVGGSFAGLSAALQLARARRTVLVVDGGKPRNRFATASHGFLGQDGLPPQQILATARAQLAAYPEISFVDGLVDKAEKTVSGFSIELADGARVQAKRLILASGMKDHLPEIPGLQALWGKTVIHCPYCHGYEFAGRELAVLAVGPVSLHMGMLIPEWGNATLLLNDALVLEEEQRHELERRRVQLVAGRVSHIESLADERISVHLTDGRALIFSAMFVAARPELNGTLAEQLGCALEAGPMGDFIRTDEFKETSVEGVYAAGDIVRFAPNVTWAVADGVTAGLAVHRSLVFPKH
jgi:thioredoxin reductase